MNSEKFDMSISWPNIKLEATNIAASTLTKEQLAALPGREAISQIAKQRLQPRQLIVHCPHCQEADKNQLTLIFHQSTLVGQAAANHHWKEYSCNSCNKNFVYEFKGDHEWYSIDIQGRREILEGISTCYECYLYRCAKCNGLVEKEAREPDGATPYTRNSFTMPMGTDRDEPERWQHRYFYRCQNPACAQEIEIHPSC